MLRYAITDRIRLAAEASEQAEPARQSALLDQVARLAADGIDFIQLREKDLSTTALAGLTRRLLAGLRSESNDSTNGPLTRPRLLINSRADIAVATRADGVHITSAPGALTPAQVRALYASAGLADPIVSVSCHTLDEITRAASANPADRPTHILFGPVFEKVVAEARPNQKSIADKKIAAGAGLDLLRAACLAAAPVPVLALGGISKENTAACIAAGAAGVAAIRLFL